MVSFPSGSETISGYLATPEGAGKKPAVVVIHEWWGLNEFAKGKADGFAKQGYVALAVDLYRGKVTGRIRTRRTSSCAGMPNDRAMRDMKAAVAYLRARPDVEGSRRSARWAGAWAAGYSLALAVAEPSLSGAVIYYGRLDDRPGDDRSA